MTNVQLYLAICLPIIANAAMIILLQASIHRQMDAIGKRIDRAESQLDRVDADVKILTAKVYETGQ
jgi:hypothetical protein